MPATQPRGQTPTTTHVLTFTDPPGVARRGSTDWKSVAAQLRSQPGEWAIVSQDSYPTVAHNITTGRYADFRPAGTFDAVSRSTVNDDGKRIFTTYAKYTDTEAGAA